MKTPCIPTIHCKNNKGYGVVRHNGKNQLSHRLAYANANGLAIEDIKGWVIRHKCDNPLCVNPEHLVRGTHKENSMDMVERGRQARNRGEQSGMAKLTEKDVLSIKDRLDEGATGASLAKEFGVTHTTIYAIRDGRLWPHLHNDSINMTGLEDK